MHVQLRVQLEAGWAVGAGEQTGVSKSTSSRFAAPLASPRCALLVGEHVAFKRGRLREGLGADGAGEGAWWTVAQAVAQQASGSWETLPTYVTVEQLLARVLEDMLAQEATPRETLPTVRALMGKRRA